MVLIWLSLVALVASAVVAGNAFSLRDRLMGSAAPKPRAPVASRVAGASAKDAQVPGGATRGETTLPATSLRSEPWWQDVTILQGVGTGISSPFKISDNALQWRVKWTCDAGHLVVRVPTRSKAMVDAACPNGNPAYAVQSGEMSLQITADGPWRLQVAQEIDAPLVEPLSPAMTATGASAIATGTFYRVDQNGTGSLTLYHQADGSYSFRLENFFVSPTTDLELRVSTLTAPHSSTDLLAAHSELVAAMDVTAGSLNFALPSAIDPAQFRSLYVWCALTQSAYSAASLMSVR